jgi:phytoene synthase
MPVTDATAGHNPEGAIRTGSKSFALASRLFDNRTRQLVWDLYAWCRHCDDVVDGQNLGHGPISREPQHAALDGLRRDSDRALAGSDALTAPFAGLARVAAVTGLPGAFVHQHLDGFAMDVAGRRYVSLDDTLQYCYGVAGVVGLMMAWIMGVRDRPTLLRACDLGLGFQLTNIARDVGDDLDAGRVYLPESWLRESGAALAPGASTTSSTRQALVPVVARLLDEADRYYASSWFGIARLPFRSAWAVATARRVYADIGAEVRRRGPRAWDTRVGTTKARKLTRLALAAAEASWLVTAGRHAEAPVRRGLWLPSDAMLGWPA